MVAKLIAIRQTRAKNRIISTHLGRIMYSVWRTQHMTYVNVPAASSLPSARLARIIAL
nr:hypothetical protein [Paenibacillus xylanexedens]